MKLLLELILIVSLIVLGVYIYKSFKKEHRLVKLVRNVNICGFLIILFNLLAMVSTQKTVSLVCYSCYFIMMDCFLYYLLQFSIEYVGSSFSSKVRIKYMILMLVLDIVGLVMNMFTGDLFTLEAVTVFHTDKFFAFSATPFFYSHYGIVIMLSIFCLITLYYKVIVSPAFYRKKYLIIAVIMTMLTIKNIMSIRFAFDVTIVGYAAIGVCIYYCVFLFVPHKLLSETMFQVAKNMSVGVLVMDIEGNNMYCNKYAQRLMKSDEKLLNRDMLTLEEYCRNHYMRNQGETMVEETFYKGTKELILKIELQRIVDSREYIQGGYFIIQDRTEEINKLSKERYKATHDNLTKLYNREYFYEQTGKYIRQHPDTELYLICTDIKDFKMINDFMGVKTGNTVLINFARMLEKKICGAITIGRITNDIFAILMLKDDYNEQLFSYAKREEFFAGVKIKATLPIVTYIGIYEVTDRNLPVSIMCDRARMAISTIKGDYNKRIAFYDNILRENTLHEQELINDLNTAIVDKQLKMFLQPQMSSEGKLLGAEALVRWKHPQKGQIMPGDFISVFEKNGLISYVDMYIWDVACKYLRKWKKAGREDLYISVNISPRDFYFLDIYEIFTELIKKYEINPSNLKLEITETAIVMDFKRQVELITKLRNAGFVVEMDDFGSGYSSLNMLKDIHVDILKIDMEFLKEAEDKERSRKILQMIISLSKSLGMPVICEGVETEAQLRLLQEMECEMFQGYYFAKPMPVEEYEKKYL